MKGKLFFSASIVLCVLFTLLFMSCYQTGKLGPLDWKLKDGTLTISGKGPMPNLKGYNSPWKGPIISVIINDGVTTIGDYVFFEHNNLVSVSIPNTVTYIGSSAFKRCNNLYMITIPENVMLIGNEAFEDCGKLEIINILINNPIQTDAFNRSLSKIFSRGTINNSILYVPPNTIEKYKASGWDSFKNIREGTGIQ